MLVVNVRCDGEVEQLEEKAIMPEKKDHLLSDASSDLESSDNYESEEDEEVEILEDKDTPMLYLIDLK